MVEETRYINLIDECTQTMSNIQNWIKANTTETPSKGQIRDIAELAARLKYTEQVTYL